MLWTSFFRSVEGRADVLFSPHPLEETRSELFWGETGLKIRPDVFRHDNCERISYLF